MSKISQDAKETAIEIIRIHGTMKAGAEAAGVSVRTLNEEMRKSAIFKRRVLEAREEGKQNVADSRLQFVIDVAEGKQEVKMPQLTANLSILNWGIPGFRGAQKIEGRIEHDVRVITAVPRPKYEELDNPPKKMLKSSKRTRKVEIRDEQGNYIGTQIVEHSSVEEAIEGEVINDKDSADN